MTWLIGIVIFVTGVAVGFLVNKFLPVIGNEKQELTEELQQSQQAQASLKRELTDYLDQVELSFQQLADKAESAAATAQSYNDKLKKSDQPAEEIIPYFGNAVSEGLQQTKPVEQLSKKLEKADKENAPRDYTEGNSGILVGDNEK